jgi:transcriptional regulator with PAS, ATPase and Fis domain
MTGKKMPTRETSQPLTANGSPFITPLVGASDNIRRIRELIGHVADTALNVVICGESGVGKEVVAKNLYKASPRFGKPFLKINCAALPEGLLESELFGHESGAFTGASRRKRGKFELAHGGVLMLDEIGDMSLPLQAKMLHVLQSGEFSPLGSEKDLHSNAWIIAATNQELETAVQQGTFRKDLFYRLNIIRIQIAPLRERPEDIPLLIEHFIALYTGRFERKIDLRLNAESMRKLVEYSWPGNARELESVIQRMMVLGRCEEVIEGLAQAADTTNNESHNAKTGNPALAPYMKDLLSLDKDTPLPPSFSLRTFKKKAMDQVEREVISLVLQKTNWNRSKANKILKISYKTLLYKINELGLEPPAKSGGNDAPEN